MTNVWGGGLFKKLRARIIKKIISNKKTFSYGGKLFNEKQNIGAHGKRLSNYFLANFCFPILYSKNSII